MVPEVHYRTPAALVVFSFADLRGHEFPIPGLNFNVQDGSLDLLWHMGKPDNFGS